VYVLNCETEQTSSDIGSVAGPRWDDETSRSSSAALAALPPAHVWWPGLHKQSTYCTHHCHQRCSALRVIWTVQILFYSVRAGPGTCVSVSWPDGV